MEKHHMDQNPYVSSLCVEPGVVSENMTWGDDVAKRLGQAGFGANEIMLSSYVMLSR
jgi:hypothetical protein